MSRIVGFISNNWKDCFYWCLLIFWSSLAGFCFIYILDASFHGGSSVMVNDLLGFFGK